jgi:hypothetical protein
LACQESQPTGKSSHFEHEVAGEDVGDEEDRDHQEHAGNRRRQVVEERAASDGCEEPEEDAHRHRPRRGEQDQLRGDRKALLRRLVHRVVAVDEARAELERDTLRTYVANSTNQGSSRL